MLFLQIIVINVVNILLLSVTLLSCVCLLYFSKILFFLVIKLEVDEVYLNILDYMFYIMKSTNLLVRSLVPACTTNYGYYGFMY